MFISKCLRAEAFRTGPQWWKPPVFYQPVVSPLERGPDFSFADGRRPAFTNIEEFERRLKQVELGKQVVRYLEELRCAEAMYTEHRALRAQGQRLIEQNTPRAKGDEQIF